jgi:sterol desaturase/sphingolipid hydroxylase (fatty acid hydroxylase superfamily)
MKIALFLDSTGPAKAAAHFVHHTRGDSNFALSTIFRDGIFGDIPLASQP